MPTEEIVIEFKAEYSSLEGAVNVLEKGGERMAVPFKQTSAAILAQQQALQKLAASVRGPITSFDQLDKRAQNFIKNFVEGFSEGIEVELKNAKKEIDEMRKKLEESGNKGGKAVDKLKKELRDLRKAIADANAGGGPVTQQMIDRAGELESAIQNADKAIRFAGSDTQTLDAVIGTTQAIAGGFAVAQGAAALFGDESEELQETLLQVNAAMSIMQGLQSVQNALTKQGAINQLGMVVAQKAANAQLALNTALESENIIVKGLATVAQKALNAAMSANPIGIIILALAIAIPLLAKWAENTRAVAAANADLDSAIRASTESLNNQIDFANDQTEKRLTQISKEKGLESQRIAAQIDGLKAITKARQEAFEENQRVIDATEDAAANDEEINKKRQALIKQNSDFEITARKDQIAANKLLLAQEQALTEESIKGSIARTETSLNAVKEGSKAQLNLRKLLVQQQAQLELQAENLTQAQRVKITSDANKRILELDVEFQKRLAQQRVAATENQLVNVEQNTVEEFKLRSRLINEQMAVELADTTKSEAEKNAIRERAAQEQIKLAKDTNRKLAEIGIADEISRNAAIIARRNTSDADRLQSTINNIELAAAAEVLAADGNAAAIKEAYAKRDAAIRDTKKQFILDAVKYEQELTTALNGDYIRGQQRILNSGKHTTGERIAAIKKLSDLEIANIDEQITANDKLNTDKLISDKDYVLENAKLQDKRKAKSQQTDEEIKLAQKEALKQSIDFTLQAVAAIGAGFAAISQERAKATQINIDNQRKEVDEQLKAGLITEKEAKKRQQRIDDAEKQLRRKQAIREKQQALFGAFLSMAQGIVNSFSSLVPPFSYINAALVAAIGAAQIAAISARPIPNFRTGKKSRWQGLGRYGEAGAELRVNADGRMEYATKPVVDYIGAKDIIYNPAETKQIMDAANARPMRGIPLAKREPGIDYEKLGAAVGKNSKQPNISINVDKQFIRESVADGLRNRNFYDNRYSFKK